MKYEWKRNFVSHEHFDGGVILEFSSTTTKTNKLVIASEIEKVIFSTLAVTEFKKKSTLSTHEIVEFVLYMRQRWGFATCKTFNAANDSVLDLMQCVTEHETKHILFDSCLKISIKGWEQVDRKGEEKGTTLLQ